MSLKQRITDRIDDIRTRHPFLDHLVRTVQHYGAVKGNIQAGAVTYFAFLSFFPILALAFAIVGWVARIYPDAQRDLVDAIDQVLPDLVGNDPGQVSLSSIQSAAGAAVGLGLLGVLYSGLGWLSAMRDALLVVFEKPSKDQPNFVVGKLRDLAAMVSIGVVLILSVAVSGVVTSFSTEILDGLGLGTGLGWLLSAVSILVGLLANMVLFYALFRLLAEPDLPSRSLWSGALFGAIGFEVLKQVSRFLLQSTSQSPAFQAFGIALILLVWINYFSRLVMYAAAWAHTSTAARLSTRAVDSGTDPGGDAEQDGVRGIGARPADTAVTARHRGALLFAAGGMSALGLVAVLTRRKKS